MKGPESKAPSGDKKAKSPAMRKTTPSSAKKALDKGRSAVISQIDNAKKKVDSIAEESPQWSLSRLPKIRLNSPLFVISVALILLLGYIFMSNSTVTLDEKTVNIPGLSKDLENYTILLVSDLHGQRFGENQAALLRTVNGLSYNMLIMSGDMIGTSGNAAPLYEFLDGLTAKRPAYIIAGDSDPAPLLKEARDIEAPLSQLVLNDWVLGVEERGATYLFSPASLDVGSSRIWLSPDSQLSMNIPETLLTMEDQLTQEREGVSLGIKSDYATLPFTNFRYNQILKLQKAASDMSGTTDLHISVAHFPPSNEFVAVSQSLNQSDNKVYLRTADLIVAGHYCGGGWRIPIYGALYIPNTLYARHGWLPNQSDVQGMKVLGATTLYTTPGLGMTNAIKMPKIRVFNSPQVSLIKLTSSMSDDLLGN